MENIERNTDLKSSRNSIPLLDKDHGYYASASVTNPVEDTFDFFQNQDHVRKVLEDLPEGINNFLELQLSTAEAVSPDEYRVVWNNIQKNARGNLNFLIKASPIKGGSIITIEAVLEGIKFKDESPSTLMNILLKRMKALLETGVLATTKGQPSGREELKLH
jgi:hypothetical protein